MKKMSMMVAFLVALMIAGGALALTDTEAETAAAPMCLPRRS